MAFNPVFTIEEGRWNNPHPGGREVFPEPAEPGLGRMITMPNSAVDGIITIGGIHAPNKSPTANWDVAILIDNVTYVPTTSNGVWDLTIPAGRLAAGTLYYITVVRATCNGKNAWPADSEQHMVSFG